MAESRFSRLGSRERALVIILGVVVLLLVAYFLFLKPGDDTQGHQLAPNPVPGTTRPTTSPSQGPSNVPGTSEVFEGKDPFKPLVGTQGGGTPSPGSTEPGSSGGPTGGEQVTLLDIFKEGDVLFASVQVNGVEYKVKEGDTFDGNFRVVSLSEKCGTFVFGDERFTLCIGQEVFK